MSEGETTVPVYIDAIPTLLKSPVSGGEQRTAMINMLAKEMATRAEAAVDRWAALPAIIVQQGDYCRLLVEARELYCQGHFYACVTMCGVVAERIVKDLFASRFVAVSKGRRIPITERLRQCVNGINARHICELLLEMHVVDEGLRSDFVNLGELRNTYAHANGSCPERDARDAVRYLHNIVEGTVSVLKDHYVRDGVLVPK